MHTTSLDPQVRKKDDGQLVFWFHLLQPAIHISEEPRHDRRDHPQTSGFGRGGLVDRRGLRASLAVEQVGPPLHLD